jgi:hypothetical protein
MKSILLRLLPCGTSESWSRSTVEMERGRPAEDLLRTELWLHVISHLDVATRLQLLSVCRLFRDLVLNRKSNHLLIAVGVTAERVKSRYLVQPYHQLVQNDANSPKVDRFRGYSPSAEMLCVHSAQALHSPYFARLPSYFAFLQTVVLHIRPSEAASCKLDVRYFNKLKTLEIYCRLPFKEDELEMLSNTQSKRLPHLRRLVLFGFVLPYVLLVCPNLQVLKCELPQFRIMMKFDIKHLLELNRTCSLTKLHIWHHDQSNVHVISAPQPEWDQVFRLEKVTLQTEWPFCIAKLPVFANVPRVSFKHNLSANVQAENRAHFAPWLRAIPQQYDLSRTHFTINGLRITAETSEQTLFNFFDKYLDGAQELKDWQFDRESVDRCRARYAQYNEVFGWYGTDILNFTTIHKLHLSDWLPQRQLELIADNLPNICNFALLPDNESGYTDGTYDLSFLLRMKSLNKLRLCTIRVKDESVLGQVVTNNTALHIFHAYQWMQSSTADDIYDRFVCKATRDPSRLFEFGLLEGIHFNGAGQSDNFKCFQFQTDR